MLASLSFKSRGSLLDWSILINILWGGVVLLGGTVVVSTRERLNSLEEQLKEIPNVYARRDDVKDRFQEILTALGRIEDKVDKKNG